jgi:hypothetical protein
MANRKELAALTFGQVFYYHVPQDYIHRVELFRIQSQLAAPNHVVLQQNS